MTGKKITLIGSGNIGGTLAHLALLKNLGNIVLFDIVEGIPQGKALDLVQSCTLEGIDGNIIGTNNYKDIKNSDVVIVTAGIPRKKNMSRNDLLEINAKIMKNVGTAIQKHCPNAFVICITNPLDIMVNILQHYSNIPDHKIVGMAGVLDSARFRTFLAWEFKVSVKQVHAYVMGGHGDSMVPLTGITNIAGISLNTLLDENKISQQSLEKIIERTRTGGGEIVKLLKNGSAYYAPAISAIQMTESYLFNKGNILPCATKIKKGMYNIEKNIFIGVPTKITANGVEPLNIKLTAQETKQFRISIDAVKELYNIADQLHLMT